MVEAKHKARFNQIQAIEHMNLSEVFRSAARAIIEREGVQEISAILIITAILTSIECLGNFWREVCTRADKHQIRNVLSIAYISYACNQL